MDAYTLKLWQQLTTDAAKHARCGHRAACRRNAIDDVDTFLDTARNMDVPNVQAAQSSPVTG